MYLCGGSGRKIKQFVYKREQFVKKPWRYKINNNKQRGPGGTGGSEKLDSSNQPGHIQGREKRRPSKLNVVGTNHALGRVT